MRGRQRRLSRLGRRRRRPRLRGGRALSCCRAVLCGPTWGVMFGRRPGALLASCRRLQGRPGRPGWRLLNLAGSGCEFRRDGSRRWIAAARILIASLTHG